MQEEMNRRSSGDQTFSGQRNKWRSTHSNNKNEDFWENFETWKKEKAKSEEMKKEKTISERFWEKMFKTLFKDVPNAKNINYVAPNITSRIILSYDAYNQVINTYCKEENIATIFLFYGVLTFHTKENATVSMKMDYDTKVHQVEDKLRNVLGYISDKENLFSILFRPWYSSHLITQQNGISYNAVRYSFFGSTMFSFYNQNYKLIGQARVFPLDQTSFAINVDKSFIGDPVFPILLVSSYINHKRRNFLVRFFDHILAFFSVIVRSIKF